MSDGTQLHISEILANFAQAAVVLGAAVFFLFRLAHGWIYTNLTLTSSVHRTRSVSDESTDNFIVSIKLEKGDRSNAELQSVVIKAFDLNNSCKEISEQKPNIKHPLKPRNINLPPGETVQFEELFLLDKDSSVEFETTVTASRAIWKTTTISLPIGDS